MLRSTFPGHRRYSITHRAVQRLRELVPGLGEDDDENVRDQLDQAIGRAEDENKAIRTLDVMLSEPQVLVPLENFGEVLYAIIKEETVVTVLPRGHGEEILQRGQALEQRVAAGEVRMQDRDEPERYDHRRRWRRESSAPIVERIMRPSNSGTGSHTISSDNFETVDRPTRHIAPPAPVAPSIQPIVAQPIVAQPIVAQPIVAQPVAAAPPTPAPLIRQAATPVAPQPIVSTTAVTRKPMTPVEHAIARGLELGRRRAAVAALRETLQTADPETAFEPIWELLSQKGIAPAITLGDLSEVLSKP